MGLQAQKKLRAYFEMQKALDTQLNKGDVLEEWRQHQVASAFRDRTTNSKLQEVTLRSAETVAHEPGKKNK